MKPKRLSISIFVLSAVVLVFSLASASENPIVFAGDKNFPPVEYLEQDVPKGLNIDLLRELSKAMGKKIDIRLMQWKEAQEKVLNGEVDALTTISITEKRKELFDFSEITLKYQYSIFVRTERVGIQTVEDLEGKTVAATEGGAPRQVLESNERIKLVFIKDYLDGFRLLLSKEIDAVAADRWVGAYTLQQNGIQGITIRGEPIAERQAGIAVKKGNLELLNEINLGIRKLIHDGTIKKIEEKWAPKEVIFLTREQIHQKAVYAVVILLIAVLGVALFWILSLRRINASLRGSRREALKLRDDALEARRQAEQALEALRESEQRFRLALRNAPVSVAAQDRDLKYIWAFNQRTARPEEIIGRRDDEIFTPEEATHVTAIKRRVLEENIELREQIWFNRPSGRIFLDICWEPIHDEAGNVTGVASATVDLTPVKLAEEALLENEEKFRTAFHTSPSIMVISSLKDGRYIETNHAFEKVMGYSRKEMLDGPTSIEAGIWPDPRERQRLAEILLTQGQIDNAEATLRAKDGELKTVVLSARMITLKGEAYILSAWLDITERKQVERELLSTKLEAEAEKRRLEAVLQSLPVGVIVTDAQGGVLLTNKRDEDIWGPRPKTTEVDDYMQYKAWWPDSGRPVEPHEWASAQAVLKGESVFGQLMEIERFDGRRGYVHNSAVPIYDEKGSIAGSAVAVQDISELRYAEKALKQLNETLEQRVVERTELAEARSRQLQTLAVELIEAEERERRRIAVLLHENLQQILASARFQLQTACRSLPHQQILSNVDRLLEESIGKSRSLSHELSPPVLHQSGLISALKGLIQQMSDQFGLDVRLEANSEQDFDRSPLKVFMYRALQELFFNVAKHAGVKSARVILSGSDGSLVITVIDRGRGFNPDILDSYGVKKGFGLLTLRERAAYIGGSLRIESTPGRGSRFTLTVPLGVSKPGEQQLEPEAERQLRTRAMEAGYAADGIRVLFADDHKVMRQGLISMLSDQPDIQVVGEAANGREALEKTRQLKPDVIVMDICMPEMDGVEATRRIKAEFPEVRVIGLSMYEDELLARTMRQAGAEAFLSKTASSAELLKAIYGIRDNSG